MLGRTGRIVFGGAAALVLLSGCGAGAAINSAPGPGMAGTSVSDALVAEVTGPDPLAITGEQAKICAQQTPGGFSRFAILVHNTTGVSFTINSVALIQPESLSITSARAAPANRAGHGNHGGPPAPGAGGPLARRPQPPPDTQVIPARRPRLPPVELQPRPANPARLPVTRSVRERTLTSSSMLPSPRLPRPGRPGTSR